MVNLTETELLALKIIAIGRTGGLKSFACDKCTEEMQTKRNCEGIDSDTSVFFSTLTGELNACPLKFIPEVIYDFIDEYDFYEKYPSSAPNYMDINPRFWEAVKSFEGYYIGLQNNNIKEKEKENTKADPSDMLSHFNKGR